MANCPSEFASGEFIIPPKRDFCLTNQSAFENVEDLNVSNKRVVIVDDDTIALRPYFMELEISGIDVTSFENADDGFEFSQNNSADLYLIDVMLGTRNDGSSRYNRDNTMDYLFTGCVLARDIRNHGVDTPIIFFTQTSKRYALEEIQRQAKEIGNCALLSKSRMEKMFDFQEIILEVLEKGIEETSKRDWFSWIYKSVLLQPNIAGLGVDLKTAAGGPRKKINKS